MYLKNREADDVNSSLKASRLETQKESLFQFWAESMKKNRYPILKTVKQEEFPSTCSIINFFVFIQAFSRLDVACQLEGEQFALLSLLT